MLPLKFATLESVLDQVTDDALIAAVDPSSKVAMAPTV
jgi:hypothetical protein